MYRFDAPLIFTNCDFLVDDLTTRIRAADPAIQRVVLDFETIEEVDTTGLDVLVRLNGALAQTTLKLDISGALTSIVHIDRRSDGPAAHVNDSAHVFVADWAKATVIETFSGSDAAHVANHGSYVSLGAGAELTHVLLDLNSGATTNFATAEYHIGADARLRTLTIHVGSGLSRINLFARFEGEGAHADTTGLILLTSLYLFSYTHIQTEDCYFNGFPAMWNLVVNVMFVLQSPAKVNVVIVIVMSVFTVVPVKFIHPIRVRDFRTFTISVLVVWLVSLMYLTWSIEKWTDGCTSACLSTGPKIAQGVVYLGAAWIVGVGVWRTFRGDPHAEQLTTAA